MSGNVAFITGAGSGIGQLTARGLLAAGWKVAALDMNSAGLDALGNSPQLLKLTCDVTDGPAVNAAVARAEAELGPIDRLVNAAAIMPLGLLMDHAPDKTLRVMAINYGGLVNVVHAALPRMLARRRGEFISYASMAGHLPTIYMGAYDASKFAVTAYTEVLYHENRDSGVHFACVCPPIVATSLLQQARDTVWPKAFDQSEPLSPQAVVEAVEQGLKKGDFWIFPGQRTKLVWRLRRFFPDLIWQQIHKAEGR